MKQNLSNYDLNNFAEKILEVDLKEVTINKSTFSLQQGHKYSINNQKGDLAETNFFGNRLKYTVNQNNLEIPISIQLYENTSGHYRIFVFNKMGMLTSVNLTKGYSDGKIKLQIQLRLSNRNMTKEERAKLRDMLVFDVENEGIRIAGKNTVYFGEYDVSKEDFIDTNPKKFLEELVKVAIIKGHYMKNKGYELKAL